MRVDSRDLVNWGGSTTVFQAPDDRPDLEYYMMLPHAIPLSDAYHGWMLGFLHLFHVDPEGKIHPSGHAYMSGTIDVSLAISRDTLDWKQLDPDEPFIPLGPDGAFDDGMILVGAMCEFEDRLYIYYTGWNADHGTFVGEPEPDSRAQVGLAMLRLDGFVALEPAHGRGVLVTTSFVLSGSHVEVNADASAGTVVVEVLDVDGNVISGFDEDSSAPLTQDGVRLGASWRDGAGLTALAGRTARLRFTLTGGARLYAFQVLGDAAG